jgi:hypothetical protein
VYNFEPKLLIINCNKKGRGFYTAKGGELRYILNEQPLVLHLMNKPTYETAYLIYQISPGDVLEATYKENVKHVDLALAQAIVADRVAFQKDKTFKLLIQERRGANFTKEARVYLAGKEGLVGLSAIAILARNWVTYATASFILAIQKPKVPTRIFREESDARTWLQKQKVSVHRSATD